ncbi:mannose-6-phosphate isomerase, class I [Nocardioides ferulae]|uniref:mannose-6-phosphate isomerase, class I n=1 Tax=Nocardioides ferulae TaxID=2340821 RepID=UPI0013DE206C|nr:mannose-6-phosphate isomerase, class I [Nocardioides ferulae]
MYRLTCATRPYAWGSRTHLPRFRDEEPGDGPQAEMWIGAHPGDPSLLPDGTRLDDRIREHPLATVGPASAELFGPRLPFLVKALAAAEPLSLQVHPTSERARIGYAEEEAAGIPLGAPNRRYQDPFHKPELIYALTRFEGMAGFRDTEKSAAILRLFGLPWADELSWRLEDGPAYQTLHAVVAEMLAMSGDPLRDLIAQLGDAAVRAEERSHSTRMPSGRRYRERTSVEREGTRVFAQTAALAKRYPDDPGVLVTLLLNHVVLAPGEAMFLDAGVVHAYTSGFGVEVMASSDNVVRAGLTPKYVDVPELLDIASFTPIPPPLWEPTLVRRGVLCFDPPVTEFALFVVEPPEGELVEQLADTGPRTVLALDGTVTVHTAAGSSEISRGHALFLGDADGPVTLSGQGRVALATVPAH